VSISDPKYDPSVAKQAPARTQEVEYRLRIHAARNEPVVATLIRMLDLFTDKALKSMAGCEKDELPELQGRYHAFKEVAKWINEPLQRTAPVDKR